MSKSIWESWTPDELSKELRERYTITDTSREASYSMRTLLKVVCNQCGQTLHEGTTYPNAYIEIHEKDCTENS